MLRGGSWCCARFCTGWGAGCPPRSPALCSVAQRGPEAGQQPHGTGMVFEINCSGYRVLGGCCRGALLWAAGTLWGWAELGWCCQAQGIPPWHRGPITAQGSASSLLLLLLLLHLLHRFPSQPQPHPILASSHQRGAGRTSGKHLDPVGAGGTGLGGSYFCRGLGRVQRGPSTVWGWDSAGSTGRM